MTEESSSSPTRCFQVAGFVLAGGDSSRMGKDKGSLEIDGIPLVVRAVKLVEPLVSKRGGVTVVAPPERYAEAGLRVVPDDRPGEGPLGGITTAVRVSLCPWCLVVGCDLPYLTTEWLGHLASRAVASKADIVVPEGPRGPEPLCAVYHKRCEQYFATALANQKRKITDAFVGREVDLIPASEWQRFDSDGLLFKNVNSPEDFAEAQTRLRGK